jgi:hypothetical protein
MYNIIWLSLLECLDSIAVTEFKLNAKQIEALLAIDIELVRRDAEIEDLKLELWEINKCLEKTNQK